ncbi:MULTISPECIES: flagellar biosynthesis anti-sigma factor FlgM [Providencia]|uniref:Negative regulator of flagellin synthesis n=2 Tax=Providencia TaxID=586 RepID=A0AA42FF44_9GAMM|nr:MULTISPECIES: flagellar biosynthesis anti-sigma factor FlgM [Providencia]HCI95571.1 flagellar biosynthesis anti-sigma factor FlgM [Providencia sp.]APC11163.1 Negative regulator of flagellin synthesis [Providencia rettgeri]AVL74765.1 flagellar biosynthesis anti-sigma factor FlgM [Providencia rettgeri]EIL1981533.1 flagellar biosynthesis anti-sigma factor FlgM [Providencia rettgeri]EIU7558019.1 flagellar biosynthesis anti-sigma factor FlgM [Providencia rettgeri]
MAIEQTPAISALTQVTNRDPQDTATPMRDKKISTNEIIKESTFVPSELQKKLLQPQASDINSAKVEQIKQAIKDGTLKMDAEKIADGILRDAHECMLSMK